MSKEGQHALVQVLVAVLALAGMLGSALIANWDRVFPARPAATGEATSAPVASASMVPVAPSPSPGSASHPTAHVAGPLLGAANAEAAEEPVQVGRPDPASLYHVVVASLPTQGEAVTRARALRAAGHPSEVVLSTTGVFGVTLGSYSRAEAFERAAQAKRSGEAPADTFVLPPDRWQMTVFPGPGSRVR